MEKLQRCIQSGDPPHHAVPRVYVHVFVGGLQDLCTLIIPGVCVCVWRVIGLVTGGELQLSLSAASF